MNWWLKVVGEKGKWRVSARGVGSLFGVIKNVLKSTVVIVLQPREYTKSHWIYTPNGWMVWYVNCISIQPDGWMGGQMDGGGQPPRWLLLIAVSWTYDLMMPPPTQNKGCLCLSRVLWEGQCVMWEAGLWRHGGFWCAPLGHSRAQPRHCKDTPGAPGEVPGDRDRGFSPTAGTN